METASTTTSSMECEKGVVPPPPPTAPAASEWRMWGWVDALLRVLLLAASVVVVVVMVTSKQNKVLNFPGLPFPISRPAKFNYSPAFIYFVAAFSVTILYSLITGLTSLSFISKPTPAKWLLILITLDAVMLGIAASATGAAGGVAYIGLKGNSHVNWTKICNSYGKFCRNLGSSVGVAVIASFVLVLLVIFNAGSLYRRVARQC